MPFFDRGREPRPPRSASSWRFADLGAPQQAVASALLGLLLSPLLVFGVLYLFALLVAPADSRHAAGERMYAGLRYSAAVRWFTAGLLLPYVVWTVWKLTLL